MQSTDNGNKPIYFGWYVCAATVFVAFVTTGARSSFGIFIIPLEEEFGWSRFMLSAAVGTGFLLAILVFRCRGLFRSAATNDESEGADCNQ